MGVKSSYYVTRLQAEKMYVDFRFEQERRKFRAEAALLEDKELGEKLTEMNDDAKDGEGFNRYHVIGDQDD